MTTAPRPTEPLDLPPQCPWCGSLDLTLDNMNNHEAAHPAYFVCCEQRHCGWQTGSFKTAEEAWSAARESVTRERDELRRRVEEQEVAWMIECREGFTGWWDGRVHQGMLDCRFFNTDPNAGVRFARKEDAERVIAKSGHSCQIATDHMWVSGPQERK